MSRATPRARDAYRWWHRVGFRWGDNDAYGHVNNTVYYEWFDSSVNAWMVEQGMLDIFFQLIAPHGLLELSAIFVAAGAGLRLFWTMLVPGARSRGTALAEEGRITLAVALGLTITLFASGLLEGYVTPSTVLPWPVKVGIGVVACAVFWGYIFIVGKEAVRRGASGDDDADFRVEVAPVAA